MSKYIVIYQQSTYITTEVQAVDEDHAVHLALEEIYVGKGDYVKGETILFDVEEKND